MLPTTHPDARSQWWTGKVLNVEFLLSGVPVNHCCDGEEGL